MELTRQHDLQVVDPSVSGQLLVHILSPSDIVCDTSPYVAINTEIPKLRNLIFICTVYNVNVHADACRHAE